MIRLRLELPSDHRHTGDFDIVGLEGDKTIGSFRVSLDFDYPKIAEIFGCHSICDCGYTDGSVDCDHKTASKMIEEAGDFLDNNIGIVSYQTFGYEALLQPENV